MDAATLLAEFETIAEAPGGVGRLREVILSAAVQGKLTHQERLDEPAAALLERVLSTRSELVARGDASKRSPKPAHDEVPSELPSGWVWAPLEALTRKLGAGSTPLGGQKAYFSTGVKFLRSQNVWNEGLRLAEVAFIDRATHD